MLTPTLRAAYDAQATACLAAAERHHHLLLAVATRRAGSPEAGMDLYQQTVLNCHDAIQRRGFAGDRYEFYLLASLRNLASQEKRAARRWVALLPEHLPQAEAAPAGDARAQLAEQLAAEAKQHFTPAERVALHLHIEGYSCREIIALTGSQVDRRRLWYRLTKMKEHLRALFQQAHDALSH